MREKHYITSGTQGPQPQHNITRYMMCPSQTPRSAVKETQIKPHINWEQLFLEVLWQEDSRMEYYERRMGLRGFQSHHQHLLARYKGSHEIEIDESQTGSLLGTPQAQL